MPIVKQVTFHDIVHSFMNAPELALIANMAAQLWTRLSLGYHVVYDMAAKQKNTLMYLWLLSHAACLCGFIGSFVLPFAYDVAVVGCIVTYSMAVHRHLTFLLRDDRASLKSRTPISDLLRGENTILLAAAMLMANTHPSTLKLIPFATYATMNLISFLLLDVLPNTAFSKNSMPFLKYLETSMLSHMCYWDFVVIATYCYEWLTGRGQVCWMVFYMVTWIAKLEISELSRRSLHALVGACHYLAASTGAGFVVRSVEEIQGGLAILVPTKETFVKLGPSLPSSPRDRVESLMFDSFSIINDVSK